MKFLTAILFSLFLAFGTLPDIHAADTAQYAQPMDQYLKQFSARIKSKLQWPESETKEALAAKINVFINERNSIKKMEWVKKSGDESYDKACVSALEDAHTASFSAPIEYRDDIYAKGLLIDFQQDKVSVSVMPSNTKICPVAEDKLRKGEYKIPDLKKSPYYYYLDQRIAKKYNIPASIYRKLSSRFLLSDKKIGAIAGVSINASGKIEATEIFCPSGVEEYDAVVLKVFEKMGPLKELPPAELLNKEGFLNLVYYFSVHEDS